MNPEDRLKIMNRLNELHEQVKQIVDLQMQEIQERLSEHGVKVALTNSGRDWLANIGYDPSFGARPLRRALQKYVESPLSVSLLSGQFVPGDTILVDIDREKDTLVFRKAEESMAAEKVQPVETTG